MQVYGVGTSDRRDTSSVNAQIEADLAAGLEASADTWILPGIANKTPNRPYRDVKRR